jgi:hypothetical protein
MMMVRCGPNAEAGMTMRAVTMRAVTMRATSERTVSEASHEL